MKGRKSHRHMASWKAMMTLSVVMFFLSGVTFAEESEGVFKFRFGRRIKVMTQNLYIGADISKILDPAVITDPNPLKLFETTAQIYAMVQETDYPERARAIADQVAREDPHLIGLQEVYSVRRQSPSDYLLGNPSQTYQSECDYLAILLKELKARGLKYRVVAEVQDSDVELPILTGLNAEGPLFDDVRITDRDVVLARFDVKISEVTAQNYTDNFMVPLGPSGIKFLRGFCKVTAKVEGQQFCFVNTHLELREPSLDGIRIQRLQAHELMDSLADETLPTVLVGDFNSDPTDDPNEYAYAVMAASGFVDTWTRRWWHPEAGYTCCQDEDLLNEDSQLYERVDLIFVRNDLGKLPFSLVGPVFVHLVGDEPSDKTDGNLWPSDHAGVAAELRIPRVQFRHK